jgi:hypothetical protein
MRLTHGACGKNFPRFRYPASRGKPVILNPLKIPLDVYVSPTFFTPLQLTTVLLPRAWRVR